MPFPPYGYVQPAGLQPRQLSYLFLPFGGNIPDDAFQLHPSGGMTGVFDIPQTQSGDVQRDLDDGEFAGIDVLPGRTMNFQVIVQAAQAYTFDQARQALGGVMGPQQQEQPLFIQLDSGVYACMARPRNYQTPYDLMFEQAAAAIATFQMHATDPRWYLQPTVQTVIAQGGTGTLANTGTREMRPVFVIDGPCTNPKVTNTSLNGSPFVQINCALSAGDTLTVDMGARAADYLASGSSTPVSLWGERTSTSTPFNLPPGSSVVAFATATHGSGCQCLAQYAPAYLAI